MSVPLSGRSAARFCFSDVELPRPVDRHEVEAALFGEVQLAVGHLRAHPILHVDNDEVVLLRKRPVGQGDEVLILALRLGVARQPSVHLAARPVKVGVVLFLIEQAEQLAADLRRFFFAEHRVTLRTGIQRRLLGRLLYVGFGALFLSASGVIEIGVVEVERALILFLTRRNYFQNLAAAIIEVDAIVPQLDVNLVPTPGREAAGLVEQRAELVFDSLSESVRKVAPVGK